MDKFLIKGKKSSKFTGNNGDEVDYYWYNAKRLSDGLNLRFGSRNGDYDEGDEISAIVEKFETSNGGHMWKEVL